MMHAGTLDLSLSKLASTAQALRLSEEELKNHLKHLNELGVIDLANQRLRKKGINYLLSLSKDTPLDG
jgi:DNA-binding Lrp family transcriptional regulator